MGRFRPLHAALVKCKGLIEALLFTSKEKETFQLIQLKIYISIRCISSHFRRVKFKSFTGEHARGALAPPPHSKTRSAKETRYMVVRSARWQKT